MRLRSLCLRGVTRFVSAEPVEVDLEALGPGLVAVIGLNGAGKTTCLEAVAGALFKAFPSRPGWYESFHGRDAFIEALFDEGSHRLKVRVQVDAETRKTESFLFEDGKSLTTGRAAEFGAEIERRFGSEQLFLSSVFASQSKAGSFLLLSKVERKALFVELLGLSYLEGLQASARDTRAAAEADLIRARTRVEAHEVELVDLPDLEEKRADAQSMADQMAHAVEGARTEEASAISALERAKGAQGQLAALEANDQAAARETHAATLALRQASDLPAQARKQAADRRRAIEGTRPEEMQQRARERHEIAIAVLADRRTTLQELVEQAPKVEEARRLSATLEKERTDLEAAELALARADVDLGLADERLDAASRRLKDAEAAVERERVRLQRQAAALEAAPCATQRAWSPPKGKAEDLAATCPLLTQAREASQTLSAGLLVDPQLVAESADLEVRFAAAAEARAAAMGDADPVRLHEVLASLDELRALIDRTAPAIERAKVDLAGLDAERQRADSALAKDLEQAAAAGERAARELERVEQDLADSLLEAGERVQQAQGRLADAVARQADTMAALEKGRRRLGDMSVADADISLRTAKATREQAEEQLREADRTLASIIARVEYLQQQQTAVEEIRLAVRAAEQEVGDWSLLERALGRDGIQALEIDAAGPEVARLTNELLEACYGARFSVTFETLREKKSARGEFSEAFDVKVYDQGRERPVEALSGGEKVVVGEALGLAIAIFNARKSGIHWKTLFRDETAGALDADNAQAYVQMLRRALGLGGFEQVLFVSHSEQVWERADARLVVAGGRIEPEPRQERRIQREDLAVATGR